MIAHMKTNLKLYRCVAWAVALVAALPQLALAQITQVNPELPHMDEGSQFTSNTVMFFFALLVVLITFKVPNRVAVESPADI
jgi:hypothetical protein